MTAQAMRNRQIPEHKQLTIHNNINPEVISKLKPTTRLPRGLQGKEIVFLANVEIKDGFYGVALLVQRPHNDDISPYDWQDPVFNSDWIIVENKLIPLQQCLRINQSECIYSLLEAHFRDNGFSNYGWEVQKDVSGNATGLLIQNYSRR